MLDFFDTNLTFGNLSGLVYSSSCSVDSLRFYVYKIILSIYIKIESLIFPV